MRHVKASTARNILVVMIDSSDHITGKTGLTLTITASKNGGAFASITPTVTERTVGGYQLALTSSHTDTLGDLVLHITSTGADPQDVFMEVIAYDPQDAVRLGLTALPNAAAEAAGGLYTRGTGAGQINQPANGMVDANVVRNAGTAITATGGRQEVNMTHIDGQATSGNNATLNLKKLNIVNSTGDALVASSTGSDGNGIVATGNGAGRGIRAVGGATGWGMYLGDASTGVAGLRIEGPVCAMEVTGSAGHGIQCAGNGGAGIHSTGVSAGIEAHGNDSGAPGILAEGYDASVFAFDIPSGPGMKLVGGSANTAATETAAPGLEIKGGEGAASTNGAEAGARISGGGTNTVASAAHGLSLVGTSTGKDIDADEIDDIKTKTDSLTFTNTGEVDANVQSINDAALEGDGTSGTPWGPA